MSIVIDNTQPYAVHIHIDDESWKMFQELIQRGTNLWPDAHPEIKKFADEVTIGHVQQRYEEQASDKHRVAPGYFHSHKCSCGYLTTVRTQENEPPNYLIKCANTKLVAVSVNDKGEVTEKFVNCGRMETFNQGE